MANWFADLIYGSTPVTFKSEFPLDESIKRLSAASRRSVFSAWRSEAAVGRVAERRVSLQHVTPFFGNSFKPFFIGQFQSDNGQVVLVGCFTMLWWVKAFMTIWLGFCALWTVGVTFAVFALPATPRIMPFAGVMMFALGCGFVAFAKKLSAGDVAWLSRVIQDALSR